MATSKLTKFRLPAAKVLRFNPAGKSVPFLPDEIDRSREIVESVLGYSPKDWSPYQFAAVAAVILEMRHHHLLPADPRKKA